MRILSLQQVIKLHDDLIQAFGGTSDIHDIRLLESALAAPFQTFDGEDLYPSLQAKAAQLGFGIAANHAFQDGNKRTGAHRNAGLLGAQWHRAIVHPRGIGQYFLGSRRWKNGQCRPSSMGDRP